MNMQPLILGVILLLLVLCYILKLNQQNLKVKVKVKEGFASQVNLANKPANKLAKDMGTPDEPTLYKDAYQGAQTQLGDNLIFNMKIDPGRKEIDYETGIEYTRILVPLHIIYQLDGKYLAVFNDGKLYQKNDLYQDKLWVGPLDNSLFGSQEDGTGFRMVMLFPFNINHERQIRLIGVGQDSKLYYKESEDIQSKWIQAENESNRSQADLVYLFCDYHQDKEKYYPLLYGITTEGKFVYKNLKGEAPPNSIELDDFMKLHFTPTRNKNENLKVLKVYWDRNGFMIGVGTDFKLYQKRGIDWQTRPWETSAEIRGTNPGSNALVIDMMMDSDARMISLKLEPDAKKPMIMIRKQDQTHYLADHDDLNSVGKNPKVFTDTQLVLHKSGLDWETYLSFEDPDEVLYRSNNLQAIQQRSIMMNRLKLRKLCKNRNPTMNVEARNFKLERTMKSKETKIDTLRNELQSLITPVIKQEPFYQGL